MANVSSYPRLSGLVDTDGLYVVQSIDVVPVPKTVTGLNLRKSIGVPSLYTPPIDTDFAWVNQGTATLNTTFGNAIRTPAGAQHSLRIRKKAAPATPYTITGAFMAAVPYMAAQPGSTYGLGWRNSGAGTLAVIAAWGEQTATTSVLRSLKFNSPISINAAYVTGDPPFNGGSLGSIVWFQINDDGVNRIVRYSGDGVNFEQLHSVVRTDFLTPDEVFFYVGGSNTNVGSIITLLSWAQT